ncbi:MAG: prepilin-type N-terminal cleavage/methylation domain-containing protein [Rhodospirillaceae bacterium]|nr:prepilin-type N-terminal cleavage/methylation domain-containing protein [Rhodospirillaceae bacterium]
MRSPRRIDGFSLLEMLVAFTIAAISIGMIFNLFSGATASAAAARDTQYAVTLAQSLLAEYGSSPGVETATGVVAGRFEWSVETRPYEGRAPTGALALQQLSVEVTWATLGRRQSVTLQTLKPGQLARR